MKTNLLVAFATMLCFSQNIHAQTASSTIDDSNYPRNNVQMNLTSLWFKNYNFSYERLIARKVSIVASYRFMPSSALGDLPAGKKIFEKIATDDDRIQQTTASNQTFTAELRLYSGSKPGARGFYVSFYGRYANFKSSYPYEYNDDNGKLYSFPLNTTAKGIAGGIMIGSQWLIAKRVTFDWYILGAHYGSLNGSVNGVADLSALTPEQQQYIQDDINNSISFSSKQYINSTVNNNGVQGTLHGPFFGLRGGISVGIAF